MPQGCFHPQGSFPPNSPVRRVSEVQTELVFAVKDTPPVGVSCAGRKQIGDPKKVVFSFTNNMVVPSMGHHGTGILYLPT